MTQTRPTTTPAPPSPRDRRLAKAVSELSQGNVDVLSLDVFDTVVWRSVPDPTDAFLLLGQRLADSGRLRRGISPGGFLRVRVEAEREARRRHPDNDVPEVSLEEIYAVLPGSLFNGASADDLVAAELALETSITHPDREILQLVRWARAEHGVRVVLVSDTYLSERQLAQLLDRPGFDGLAPDQVFTSSTRGRNKGGDIFDLVIETTGARPERILHIGDHPHSDVTAPEGYGIRCVHYERLPEQLAPVLAREAGLRRGRLARDEAGVHPVAGDFGLTALRTKVATAGTPPTPDVASYWQFGASVLGPPLEAFASWVHQRASEEGAATVYPMMREGEFLARLINAVRPGDGDRVHAKPLWVSRRVCAEAAIERADVAELEVFLARRRPPTVEEYLEVLGIGVEVAEALRPRLDTRLDDASLRAEVLEALAESSEARQAIVARSAERRRRLLDHIDETTRGDRGPLVLVDLGWGATIQHHLSRIFTIEDRDQPILGLYLITTDASIGRWFDDVRSEGFLSTVGHPEDVARWVTRSPEVLEQTFMTDAGSLIAFAEDGSTVHAPYAEPPEQRLQRMAVQQGILDFHAFREEHGVPGWADVEHKNAYEDLLRLMLLRFVLEPTRHEAELFARWLHDENFGSDAQDRLFDESLARRMRYLTPEEFLRLPMTKVYWPFAVAAMSDPALASAAAAVATELLPPSAFVSDEAMRVGVLNGTGPHDLRIVENLHVPTNRNGLRYARVIWREDTAYAELHFSGGPALVRLDWLRVGYHVRGNPDPVVHELSTSDDFASLEARMCDRPAPDLLLGRSTSPGLVLPAVPDGAAVYEVELEIAFAAIELPHLAEETPTPAMSARRVAARAKRVGARALRRFR